MSYPQAPGAVELVIGASVVTSPTAVDLTFGASGPADPPKEATLNGQFVLHASVPVSYDNAAFRGVSAGLVSEHQTAQPLQQPVAGAWADALPRPSAIVARLNEAQSLQAFVGLPWLSSIAVPNCAALAWDLAAAVNVHALVPWSYPVELRAGLQAPWQLASAVGHQLTTPFQYTTRLGQQLVAPFSPAGLPASLGALAQFNDQALSAPRAFDAVWSASGVLVSSTGGPAYLPPPPALVPGDGVVVPIQFCQTLPDWAFAGNPAGGVTLIFGVDWCSGITPDAPFYILPARVYMVLHNVFATRVSDGAQVPLFGCTLAADVGSFTWQLSATGPVDLMSMLAPQAGQPVLINVSIDGANWVFIVESLRRTDSFGRSGVAISGRSATALIGAPWSAEYAYSNGSGQLAQQLAAQALDLSGVALDWGIDDWLVPAGAWSFVGTRLSAVQAIAAAAGGYVQSHRSLPTLQVRHPYPTLSGGVPGGPWNWGQGAADVELAPDAIIVSAFDRQDGPDIDGVYVSGTVAGVNALVKRTGTAGAKLASMITDPLITAAVAASQRGLSVLGTAGAKQLVTLDLPVLSGGSNPGVINVGALVQVNQTVPWRGRVRSVSVTAQMPSVRQTITLEQHL